MSIPSYEKFYIHILNNADTLQTADEYLVIVAHDMGINQDLLNIKNKTGEPKFRNRLRWAIHYLRKAKLMSKPERGKYLITERGIQTREKYGQGLNNKVLEDFPEFLHFINQNKRGGRKAESVNVDQNTPIEVVENAISVLEDDVKNSLLNQIFELSPYFFEKLVVDLFKKMGNGDFEESGATKKSNDEGIDGMIYQDALGLDIVYIQAKRYSENKVGRPDIQKFIGALSGKQTSKGIFITTSYFSEDAFNFVEKTSQKVVLVDRDKLLDLMIRYEVGLEKSQTFHMYRIDEDYFSE